MFPIWIVCFVALIAQLSVADPSAAGKRPPWNDTWTDILKRDLLITYDKFARPSQPSEKTSVSTGLTLLQADVDEDKSAFEFISYFKMSWNDPKLVWNPSDYGNLTVLHVSSHEIWQPDIMLYNTAGTGIDYFGGTNCLVFSNGSVLWVPPATLRSFCDLDMRNWPFDKHNCTIVFGSWTYNALQVDLVDTELSLSNYQVNRQWQVITTTSARMVKYYACCAEPYTSVHYSVLVQRHSPMLKAITFTPAFFVVLLILIAFWLPAQSGEKILLNGVNALIVTSWLVFIAQRIPDVSSGTPIIILFYSSSLYLLGLSMVISVMVIHMAKKNHSRPVPWFAKDHLNGRFGTFLGLDRSALLQGSPTSNSEKQCEHDQKLVQEQHMNYEPVQEHWILLATAIERSAFGIYCVFFIGQAVVCAIW